MKLWLHDIMLKGYISHWEIQLGPTLTNLSYNWDSVLSAVIQVNNPLVNAGAEGWGRVGRKWFRNILEGIGPMKKCFMPSDSCQ